MSDPPPELPFGTIIRTRRGQFGIVIGYEPMAWDRRTRPYRVVLRAEHKPVTGHRRRVRVFKFGDEVIVVREGVDIWETTP